MTRIAKIFGAAAIALVRRLQQQRQQRQPNPPVDGTKQISAASDTDKMNLCNWFAGHGRRLRQHAELLDGADRRRRRARPTA